MQKHIEPSEILCHNCGYHWTPKPERWQNAQFVNRKGRQVKILRCPACNTQIGVDRKQFRTILIELQKSPRRECRA